MKFLLFWGALACLDLVNSQCTREILNSDLVGRLLAESLAAGSQSTAPTLTVTDFEIVCLAVNTVLDQYRFASVVVEYNCTGTCSSGTTGILSQVEFGCNNNVWSEVVAGTAEGNVQTPPAQATLQTLLRSDCQTCLNNGREPSSMEPNHCIPCSGCLPPSEGLNMCAGSSQCCNVNLNGQCRPSCTPGTTTDSDFICRADCGSVLPAGMYQTGVLDDSDCTYVGCTATYRCDEGLELSDGSPSYQLRCLGGGSTTANWDANPRTCSQRCNFVHDEDARMIDVIMVEYIPPGCETTFDTTNCVANYTTGNESASCSCNRSDTTGMISCSSDDVMNLIDSLTPTTTSSSFTSTSGTPEVMGKEKEGGLSRAAIIIIIVVVVILCLIILVIIIIAIIAVSYHYKAKKKKAEVELHQTNYSEKEPL